MQNRMFQIHCWRDRAEPLLDAIEFLHLSQLTVPPPPRLYLSEIDIPHPFFFTFSLLAFPGVFFLHPLAPGQEGLLAVWLPTTVQTDEVPIEETPGRAATAPAQLHAAALSGPRPRPNPVTAAGNSQPSRATELWRETRAEPGPRAMEAEGPPGPTLLSGRLGIGR